MTSWVVTLLLISKPTLPVIIYTAAAAVAKKFSKLLFSGVHPETSIPSGKHMCFSDHAMIIYAGIFP